MANPPKNTICLWYDRDALEAARFYAKTFPDSTVGAVHRAPGDFPSGKEGNVLTVEFTVIGIPCAGLNGGPVPATPAATWAPRPPSASPSPTRPSRARRPG